MNSPLDSIYPGFIFLPLTRLPNLGYGVVEIHIGAIPIERFFDTRQALFPIVEEGSISQPVVEHPWLCEGGITRRHVCAGRFRFYESDGDEHQGYSLGGDVEISQDEDWVSCRLTSSAPIYNLQEDPSSSVRWLVDEMEGVLARRRAFYEANENIFMDRLQTVDPLILYIAIIA